MKQSFQSWQTILPLLLPERKKKPAITDIWTAKVIDLTFYWTKKK